LKKDKTKLGELIDEVVNSGKSADGLLQDARHLTSAPIASP